MDHDPADPASLAPTRGGSLNVPQVDQLKGAVKADARRAARLMTACREATGGKVSGLFWFAAEGALVREGALAPVWATPAKEGLTLWETS